MNKEDKREFKELKKKIERQTAADDLAAVHLYKSRADIPYSISEIISTFHSLMFLADIFKWSSLGFGFIIWGSSHWDFNGFLWFCVGGYGFFFFKSLSTSCLDKVIELMKFTNYYFEILEKEGKAAKKL